MSAKSLVNQLILLTLMVASLQVVVTNSHNRQTAAAARNQLTSRSSDFWPLNSPETTTGVKSAGNRGGQSEFKRARSLAATLARGEGNGRNFPQLLDDGQAAKVSLRRRSPSVGHPSGRRARQATNQQVASGQQQKCALILQRTYVRKLTNNDIESESTSAAAADVEQTGRAERVCISYEQVNEAIEEAKTRRKFKLTAELADAIQSIEPTPAQIARLGELNLETVKVLKEQFDLSPDEIAEGLPLIDMSRTSFWQLCPLLVKPIKCDPTGRFRSFTGHCNNLEQPTWGASQTPYVRYLAPRHPDGIEEFRRSLVDDSALPPARLVSSTVHRDSDQPSGDLSLFIMVFGQLVDHELTQAAPPRGHNSNRHHDERPPKTRRKFKLTAELADAIQSIEPTPAQIARLGELNLETVKVLKEQFDLSPDEIAEGLPLIDMSRTSFWQLCPLLVKPIKCDPTGRFRSFTGHCNNLEQPTWGASQTPYVRYLAPRHPDGIEEFRRSLVDDSALPPARLVSSTVHRDSDQPSGDLSLFIMVFGQLVDHELTQAAPPRDENGLDFNCCKEPAKGRDYCSPIRIPENDPLYRKYGQTCMDFKRSLVGLRPNCKLGPRVHINTITPTIDGNTIYGSTKAIADELRAFTGGLLKVQNTFKSMKLKPLLPRQLIRPDLDCFERPSEATFCFLAGDDRVNEQPTLTMMHTILVREHNRIASQLARLNAHWDDDRTFHETRHLMAAKLSAILQAEYLPMLIGPKMMAAMNLTSGKSNAEYDPDVIPAISQGFTTAAFRQGHTFIQGQLRLHDSRNFKFIESIPLRELFKRPFHYYNPGQIDKVLAGALNTPAQSYDPFITQEIAGHLFQEPGEEFGMDLISINLQRGREQGVPGYLAYRERFTKLPKVRTFEDLLSTMSNRTVHHYSRLYKSVHDIDLWSGGVSELPRDGALVGPTFAAIIGNQFAQVRSGDRFWYENPNQPSSFTKSQLREIKKSSLARLLCANSDGVQLIQRKALKLPHQIYNPLMACTDLNDADLRFWKEDPNTPGQFFE